MLIRRAGNFALSHDLSQVPLMVILRFSRPQVPRVFCCNRAARNSSFSCTGLLAHMHPRHGSG